MNAESFFKRFTAQTTLEPEQERALAIRANAGDQQARDALVLGNLKHAATIAMQSSRRTGLEFADTASAATLGLVHAASNGKYEPERGLRFITYAQFWIRNFILEMSRKKRHMTHTPEAILKNRIGQLTRAETKYMSLLGDRELVHQAIAREMQVSVEQIKTALRVLHTRDISLHDPDSNEGWEVPDQAPPVDELVAEHLDLERQRVVLQKAMRCLSPRERQIVERLLMNDEGPTLRDLGREMGISGERVRQLKETALRKLRNVLAA